MAQVGATAGLQVNASNFNGPKHAFAIHLLTNALPGEFFRSAVTNGNFPVRKDDRIGRSPRAFENQRRRLWPFQVDRADGFTQVERNGDEPKTLLKDSGKKMLTGVLLHMVEAAGAVKSAVTPPPPQPAGPPRAATDLLCPATRRPARR